MSRTLYATLRSPYVRKVRILLREKDLDVQLSIVDLNHRSPAFLALAPLRKVPVFVDEDGTVVYDSTVIAEYLEDHYPNPPMLGDNPATRLRHRLTNEVGDALSEAAVEWYFTKTRQEAAAAERAAAEVERLLNMLDEYTQERALAGAFGLGPASVVSALGYLEFRHGNFWRLAAPRLSGWFDAQHLRASVAATVPSEGPVAHPHT